MVSIGAGNVNVEFQISRPGITPGSESIHRKTDDLIAAAGKPLRTHCAQAGLAKVGVRAAESPIIESSCTSDCGCIGNVRGSAVSRAEARINSACYNRADARNGIVRHTERDSAIVSTAGRSQNNASRHLPEST